LLFALPRNKRISLKDAKHYYRLTISEITTVIHQNKHTTPRRKTKEKKYLEIECLRDNEECDQRITVE